MVSTRLQRHARHSNDLFEEMENHYEDDLLRPTRMNGMIRMNGGSRLDWIRFLLSEHGFDYLTNKSQNMNTTFLRLVKIMEEFVSGFEIFLKCVENILVLCRDLKTRQNL